MKSGIKMPADCGPHCKVKSGVLSGITIKLVHCKRKNCKQCHNKPRPAV